MGRVRRGGRGFGGMRVDNGIDFTKWWRCCGFWNEFFWMVVVSLSSRSFLRLFLLEVA